MFYNITKCELCLANSMFLQPETLVIYLIVHNQLVLG